MNKPPLFDIVNTDTETLYNMLNNAEVWASGPCPECPRPPQMEQFIEDIIAELDKRIDMT